MRKKISYYSLLPAYAILLAGFLALSFAGNHMVSVWAAMAPVPERKTVIVDAGHGGIDGGATSCTGVLESNINLEIALKLNDLMHLLGIKTLTTRQSDCSIHTEGESIAQKKVSDLKERVRIANGVDNGILVSIHQNYFADSKYSGAQVFYAPSEGSKELAQMLQMAIIRHINPDSRRQIKKADGIYLMQNVRCPSILIECGFLSNSMEESLLRSRDYQIKLSVVIASTVSMFLQQEGNQGDLVREGT